MNRGFRGGRSFGSNTAGRSPSANRGNPRRPSSLGVRRGTIPSRTSRASNPTARRGAIPSSRGQATATRSTAPRNARGGLRTSSGNRGSASRGTAARSGRSPASRQGFTRPSASQRGVGARSRGQTSRQGFTRPSASRRGSGAVARRPNSYYGYGYRGYHGGHSHGHGHSYGYHSYYKSRFFLSFAFGVGPYVGLRYYYPYYHYARARHYGFFYPYPITYAYVPYGFYCDASPVYVTRYVYVNSAATPDYEIVEDEQPLENAEDKEKVEPTPAAASPITEKYLREASELFHEAKYLEAAKKFRLAAISSPDQAAPLFALGQALIGMGSYEYAAKVIRRAVRLDAKLLQESGDIVGVYKDQAEFDRVTAELTKAADDTHAASDARFLVGVQRYFSGDPRARASFGELATALPEDDVVAAFRDGVDQRFKAEKDLPPIK